MKMHDDVRQFAEKFGQLAYNKPGHLSRRKLQERFEFLHEELQEFIDGCMAQDLTEQADALVDLVYVALGTAHMLGLPWEALWDDVQRANMEKQVGVGKRGFTVDAIKPEGWVPPKTMEILKAHGYDETSRFDTTKWRDDACHLAKVDDELPR